MKTSSLPLLLLSLALCSCASSPSASSIGSIPQKSEASAEYAIPADADLSSLGAANDARYDASKVEQVEDHPLKGKTLYWLGSSVTFGSASSGQSMADFLAAKTGARCVKEAVSGTTLYDDGGTGDSGAKSYVRRLQNSTAFNKEEKVDAFICQISTNDCTSARLSRRGVITGEDVIETEEFNVKTTLGAIEFIIAYVTDTWNCPVYFYSGAKFVDGSDKTKRQNSNPKGSDYGTLVDQTLQIMEKWKTISYVTAGVIDLYHDAEFNAKASDAYYAWAMNDPIHPRKAGYQQWWMPYFEAYLTNALAK
ncbi:MAG: hypothetical protein IJ787_01670 [Bacilli bacterium]|nr:hypothetical protein [Bacilli bacterium]